jgi:hypothetical protein
VIPLTLSGEIRTPSGTRYKLDANQPPGSRPLNLSFRTKIGEGFSDAGFQLARRIDRDYPDLGLVNDVVFTGADGSTAYEGRVEATPRDLSDRHSIGVTLAGWMAHAKERKFAMPFTDRPTSRWGQVPVERRAALAAAGISTGDFSFTQDGGGVTAALPNQALGAQTVAETWYEAPPGTLIAGVAYRGTSTSLPAGYVANISATDSRAATGADNYTPTLDDALRTIVFTTARRYVLLQVYSNGTAATPAAGATVRFTKLAAYGNHGLPGHTGDPSEPDSVYLTDALAYIAQQYCPMLNTSGIVANPYVVQHLAFNDRTWPYDAFLELNKYALWHLGVWEGKTLTYKPYDLSDYDWEIRTDDPGTTFSPQGPSTENLFNGIEVTYTDPLTGSVDVLTPETTASLADTGTGNPWNAWGIAKRDDITLTTPTLAATAAELGVAALADRNRPRTPGTITASGYVRDRAGNLQPCWKVRAGDTISITNFPNDSPRLIVETSYDDERKAVSLAIDRPFATIEAYLDRQTNALQAAGLG